MGLKDLDQNEIQELEESMYKVREITFYGSDMYNVYRTIREFPEGLKPVEQSHGS